MTDSQRGVRRRVSTHTKCFLNRVCVHIPNCQIMQIELGAEQVDYNVEPCGWAIVVSGVTEVFEVTGSHVS